MRAASGWPFYISVAVSPFKYTEADCAYQYLKLEKKIAAGADFAITQLGFDSRKSRELKRYMDERGLKTPVFGNVYVLPPKAAERMSKGEPPGCWVSPELLAKIQEEAKAEDKGLAARLERAAKMAAICAGWAMRAPTSAALITPSTFAGSSERAEELAPQWEELAEEISYGAKGRLLFLRGAQARAQAARVHAELFDLMRAGQHAGAVAQAADAAFLAGWTSIRRCARPWKTPSWRLRSRSSDARPAAIAFWA